MNASFYALYRRGRFRSFLDDDQDRMQQAERFGVSVIGLCLRHDLNFRKYFLETLFGKQTASRLKDGMTISIDPQCHWADLLLAKDSTVAVIECKPKEGLMPKQNPLEPAFRAQDGYGSLFRAEYPNKDLHFAVLKKSQEFVGTKDVLGIRCRSATWNDMIRNPQSTMETDLQDSLASLGYEEFQFMKTRAVKAGKHAEYAAELMTVLENVGKRLSFRSLTWQFESTEGKSSVGKGIVSKVSDSAQRLASKVNSAISDIAWFGYESSAASSFLSVWFYCGDKDASDDIRTRLGKMADIVGSPLPGEEHFINARLEASKSSGDQDWYLAIFEAVLSLDDRLKRVGSGFESRPTRLL